jgi:hypothetical protein
MSAEMDELMSALSGSPNATVVLSQRGVLERFRCTAVVVVQYGWQEIRAPEHTVVGRE